MSDSLFELLVRSTAIAALGTALAMLPCAWLAYRFARHDFTGKALLSALMGMPLVVPPTAVGYLLLSLLAFDGPLGSQTLGFDLGVLLTWKAAVLASVVMSTPLLLRTARTAFEGVDPALEAMARTLGYGPRATFFRVTLPLARRGLIAAAILGFTRALGEFGATVTIAGNIPGRTQTLASAIFSAQQAGDHALGTVLVVVSFVLGSAAIFVSEWLSRERPEGRRV